MAARRSYGTGALLIRTDAAGRETWYGLWYSNGRRVKRRAAASPGVARALKTRPLPAAPSGHTIGAIR